MNRGSKDHARSIHKLVSSFLPTILLPGFCRDLLSWLRKGHFHYYKFGLKARQSVGTSFLSFFSHSNFINGIFLVFYSIDILSKVQVLPLSPKLSPYPPSVEMSSKSSSVVSCGHVQTDVVAFPPTKGISLNSPPSEGINHQEECPQRIPDGNNQPGSTPPAQRQPSNWDTKDPQTK
ncbi:no significant blast hit [Histoplasma capsulatum G186AR]|uniref:Uncharacterized protein n=1 Tax=Ajellomyces capsulatus TaxID=5037 RepID=A0A8H7YCF4_AJECA|nr:hypothetical protein I7I52_12240 [Histoplasma capsulatum]QSS71256.1 no significant blast hit [Histoplasma capsulatum G186AR]